MKKNNKVMSNLPIWIYTFILIGCFIFGYNFYGELMNNRENVFTLVLMVFAPLLIEWSKHILKTEKKDKMLKLLIWFVILLVTIIITLLDVAFKSDNLLAMFLAFNLTFAPILFDVNFKKHELLKSEKSEDKTDSTLNEENKAEPVEDAKTNEKEN